MSDHSTAELIQRILNQPTAPFREGYVRAELSKILTAFKVPHFLDSAGNLIAGVGSFSELQRDFHLALVAHMDHPGFHLGTKIKNKTYQCLWFGDAPWKGMSQASVRLYDPENAGRSLRGKIVSSRKHLVRYAKSSKEGLKFVVQFEREPVEFSKNSFGGFDFPGVRKRSQLVQTRAADDLAGCVIALGALLDQAIDAKNNSRLSRRRHRPLVGIFTRAEEVGFVGCSHLIQSQELHRIGADKLWFVSLEASKELPGAILGKGPVLRVGDRATLFDSEVSALLWKSADELKTKNGLTYQRRIMDGGTCEATPLSLAGFKASALAVPLRNYHNRTPLGGVGPEGISAKDVDDARMVCGAFGKLLAKALNSKKTDPRTSAWKKEKERMIDGLLKTHQKRLRSQISYDES
jgi:putative aminopeptidase FrvX